GDCGTAHTTATTIYTDRHPVTIGNHTEITIKDLVETIDRLTNFHGDIRWETNRPDGQPRRQLDTSRAFERFGFRAQTPLEDGLQQTINWYEENLEFN